MITIKCEAGPGMVVDALEEAYQLGLRVGASISLDLNGVGCTVMGRGDFGVALCCDNTQYTRVSAASWERSEIFPSPMNGKVRDDDPSWEPDDSSNPKVGLGAP